MQDGLSPLFSHFALRVGLLNPGQPERIITFWGRYIFSLLHYSLKHNLNSDFVHLHLTYTLYVFMSVDSFSCRISLVCLVVCVIYLYVRRTGSVTFFLFHFCNLVNTENVTDAILIYLLNGYLRRAQEYFTHATADIITLRGKR